MWSVPEFPMGSIGRGVREIRIREAPGVFRLIYVVERGGQIYVLHCFQKKARKRANMIWHWRSSGSNPSGDKP
jgi:phage-related protein